MGSSNEPDTYYDDNDEHYDPEQQISVLHPDHPLMARFQNRLRTLLTERHTKIDLELRELTEGKGVKCRVNYDEYKFRLSVQFEFSIFQRYRLVPPC